VGLAAAAVLALFVIVRGLGPESNSRTLGPQRIQASVVMTVPEVPEATEPAKSEPRRRRSGGVATAARSIETVPVSAEPDPAAAALARADSRATTGFDRELRQLRQRIFRGTLGDDDRVGSSLAMQGWVEEGWVEPVRLGGDRARIPVRRASLVRPASAVLPAPWNVDQAVSLP
jgi:hypothetical protein